ncbi:hypothetical protein SAMN05216223_101574 [Actinacidiphila yanglinensis]|uniref:Uncharacterized protein n=1 Tax=Actinacidiphila yanglinensis TaxID=310779 RepID=A0A1H5TLK5_9ACTN|nr:hypothetical protein [Actinacidiphila yanglinensis]SEF63639.1 hypothetical protein SAMN05216223_101574 [Actinacidiphila yanglinensis]
MAKNRNQNRPQRDHHDERSNQANPANEAHEQHSKSALAEEHVMPAATHVARKQQKKFGHN